MNCETFDYCFLIEIVNPKVYTSIIMSNDVLVLELLQPPLLDLVSDIEDVSLSVEIAISISIFSKPVS